MQAGVFRKSYFSRDFLLRAYLFFFLHHQPTTDTSCLAVSHTYYISIRAVCSLRFPIQALRRNVQQRSHLSLTRATFAKKLNLSRT